MKRCDSVDMMRRGWSQLLLGLPAFALATALAASPSSSTIPTEIFTPPKIKHDSLKYPTSAWVQNHEGWAKLSFMVSAMGLPYAVTVVDSSGGKSIAKAAVKMVERATFTPGTRNGKPVDSGLTETMRFILTGLARGVSEQYKLRFMRAMRSIKSKDKATAIRVLNRLVPTNLTEDAYYALAQFNYAATWGTGAEELYALVRASSDANVVRNAHDGTHVFPQTLTLTIALETLNLQINLHRYASAVSTWKWLERNGLKEADRVRLAPAIAQIKHIKAAHLGYSTPGVVGATGWTIGLFEPQFSIINVAGLISEVDLYCQGGFLKFPFNPKLQYTVHGRYGSCEMTILGEPGTRFTLNQF